LEKSDAPSQNFIQTRTCPSLRTARLSFPDTS
jgi:hypothetical protein